MLRFTVKADFDKAELAKRLVAATHEAAEITARHINERVQSIIPSGGGWYDIYKQAIRVSFDPKAGEWIVKGHWPTTFSTFPADTTLVEITGDDNQDAAAALASWNPWPIDKIPAISGGLIASVIAKVASESDVQKRRDTLAPLKQMILDKLSDLNILVKENDFPRISGKIYADIGYMAKALEHGLAGLRRVPHWVVAYRAAQHNMGSWIKEEREQIEAVLRGDPVQLPMLPPARS